MATIALRICPIQDAAANVKAIQWRGFGSSRRNGQLATEAGDHGQSSIVVDVVSAIESGLSCRAAAVQFGVRASRRYIGGLQSGGRATAGPGIKVATAPRTGSSPCRGGPFTLGGEARHGWAGGSFVPFSASARPQLPSRRLVHTNVWVHPNERTSDIYRCRIKNCGP